MTRQAADAWGMLMGEADRLVEEQLEREAKAKLCPNCQRKATPSFVNLTRIRFESML